MTFFMILTVMAASLVDPLTLAGYLAAGVFIRVLWLSLAAGLGWGVAMLFVIQQLNPGYHMPGISVAGRLLGAALATGIVFAIASLVRRRRPT